MMENKTNESLNKRLKRKMKSLHLMVINVCVRSYRSMLIMKINGIALYFPCPHPYILSLSSTDMVLVLFAVM